VQWSASDLDGDRLTYDVAYSPDGGQRWMAVAMGLTENRYLWDTDRVAGSTNGLIKVSAMDGVNSGVDQSNARFVMQAKGPIVTILSPTNNSQHFLQDLIMFKGAGYDAEEGMIDDPGWRGHPVSMEPWARALSLPWPISLPANI